MGLPGQMDPRPVLIWVKMEHDPGNLLPGCAGRFGIEQPQIGDKMLLIILGDMIALGAVSATGGSSGVLAMLRSGLRPCGHPPDATRQIRLLNRYNNPQFLVQSTAFRMLTPIIMRGNKIGEMGPSMGWIYARSSASTCGACVWRRA